MEDIIVEYILGYYMHCNTPWIDVDHVLMPVHVDSMEHWILVHFDVHNRCLNIFYSLQGKLNEGKALRTIKRFSFLLPYFLELVGFFSARKDLNLSSEFYANKKPTDPLEVYMVEGLPEQQLNDCGVFVIAYAEYFIHGMLDELKKNFQVQNYRNKLSLELYMHGKKKQIKGYESDFDFKGRLSKKMKNTKT
ncbi:Ulp1 protease family, C-terminal catalytic domain containing protein [Trema orientale]|uniref:Ulp1 protease family, C-terminal catalytic domain containing protein n=1 Tax=Trema orientale TaxID=63057 RepID=A0A2P5CAI6_TREOI|nr:Ulp1 protease family, C-terminal catalytic domain containing protein [Trema orientale]